MRNLIIITTILIAIGLSKIEAQNVNLLSDTGNVGVGTLSPSTNFEVVGSTKLGGNVLIDREVKIKDSLTVQKKLIVDQDVLIKGKSVFTDEGKFKSDLRVLGTAKMKEKLVVDSTANFKDKIVVDGLGKFNGDIKLTGEFIFGNNKRIAYLPASGGNPEILSFGKTVNTDVLPLLSACNAPVTPISNQFQGMLNAYGNSAYGGMINVLSMGFDGANGIIDMAGTNSQGGPGLLINYYCGKDIFMNTGTNGGNVLMTVASGSKVGIGTQTPTQKFEIAHADETGGININQVDQLNNFKKSEIKFSLQGQQEWSLGSHLNGNDNSFFIWSHLASRTALYIAENGKVAIGGLTIPTGNSIYMLYVDGGIATRDVKVTANVFPDYVFATDYKLTPIEELERYIKKHQHLPNIQSAKEVEKNDGFEIGDMQIKLLKTVEEQTLYIIDLQKQLNELKKKVNELNAK